MNEVHAAGLGERPPAVHRWTKQNAGVEFVIHPEVLRAYWPKPLRDEASNWMCIPSRPLHPFAWSCRSADNDHLGDDGRNIGCKRNTAEQANVVETLHRLRA
ncbi:MAG: hypothetical protein ACPGO6_06500 [Candidatus Poseidoniaceae archaeon]